MCQLYALAAGGFLDLLARLLEDVAARRGEVLHYAGHEVFLAGALLQLAARQVKRRLR